MKGTSDYWANFLKNVSCLLEVMRKEITGKARDDLIMF